MVYSPHQQVSPVRHAQLGLIRNPLAVFILPFFTFGIYYLYWHYKINEELAIFDERIDVEPALSLIAALFPIAHEVSVWQTGDRISLAQQFAGRPETCSPLLGLLLKLLILGNTFYYQSQLNDLWRSHYSEAEQLYL